MRSFTPRHWGLGSRVGEWIQSLGLVGQPILEVAGRPGQARRRVGPAARRLHRDRRQTGNDGSDHLPGGGNRAWLVTTAPGTHCRGVGCRERPADGLDLGSRPQRASSCENRWRWASRAVPTGRPTKRSTMLTRPPHDARPRRARGGHAACRCSNSRQRDRHGGIPARLQGCGGNHEGRAADRRRFGLASPWPKPLSETQPVSCYRSPRSRARFCS